MRIGYAVAHPSIIAAIRKALIPFGVTSLSQQAAIASLKDVDPVMVRAKYIAAARDEFIAGLREQGWWVPDSQANFVWLPLGERSTAFENACVLESLAYRNITTSISISIGTI